jgi:rare lipoprotein A (peptidoglycan hydrolase)
MTRILEPEVAKLPLVSVALAALLSFGCESERTANKRLTETPKPTFEQTGEASWYGPGFHGKQTASGEPFNQNELTAAHRTLPLGTKAEVTVVETGKSVEVTVNDRGPYAKNRVIDLSKAAAQALDMTKEGTATVKIEAKPTRKTKRKGKKSKKPSN